MTLGSLSNYYRDKIGDVDGNALNGKSFKYKTKIIGKKTQKDHHKLEIQEMQIEHHNQQYQL